jgi:hypothetical protein
MAWRSDQVTPLLPGPRIDAAVAGVAHVYPAFV